MLKRILGVVAGVLTGFLVVGGSDHFSHKIFPVPTGVESGSYELMEDYISAIPMGAFIVMLIGHILAVVLAAAVANLILVPFHPVWFMTADVLLSVFAAVLVIFYIKRAR